jgi:hypothetical protein
MNISNITHTLLPDPTNIENKDILHNIDSTMAICRPNLLDNKFIEQYAGGQHQEKYAKGLNQEQITLQYVMTNHNSKTHDCVQRKAIEFFKYYCAIVKNTSTSKNYALLIYKIYFKVKIENDKRIDTLDETLKNTKCKILHLTILKSLKKKEEKFHLIHCHLLGFVISRMINKNISTIKLNSMLEGLSTCFKAVLLPKYKSTELLRNKQRENLEYCSRWQALPLKEEISLFNSHQSNKEEDKMFLDNLIHTNYQNTASYSKEIKFETDFLDSLYDQERIKWFDPTEKSYAEEQPLSPASWEAKLFAETVLKRSTEE